MRTNAVRSMSAAIALVFALASGVLLCGCHALPIHGDVAADANVHGNVGVQGRLDGKFDVNLTPVPDPGPIVATVVRPSASGPGGLRVAVVDVDGLLINQNMTGITSIGDNPVAALREGLEAAAADPRVRALVLRINSPGGGVTASDIMAEELRRFRRVTGKPVVACLMDLATGGAYYLAVGADRVIAHPTSITAGVGAIFNRFNLEETMAQYNIQADPIKAGDQIDMGTVTKPLDDASREALQRMTDGFRDRFRARVAQCRPGMTAADHEAIADGRVLVATEAMSHHLIDGIGYLDDAINAAQQVGGVPGAEVVLLRRPYPPTRSLYAIEPNRPLQGQMIPLSLPGLDRSKLPTFLYLWQTDPGVTSVIGP